MNIARKGGVHQFFAYMYNLPNFFSSAVIRHTFILENCGQHHYFYAKNRGGGGGGGAINKVEDTIPQL